MITGPNDATLDSQPPDDRTRQWSDLPETSSEGEHTPATGPKPESGETSGASPANFASHTHARTRRLDGASPPSSSGMTFLGDESARPEADPDDVDLPGSLQERYQLIKVLGKGGFANVYLAQDRVLDQNVAIKVLKLGRASKGDRKRFLFEARVGAKLRHPNIATIYDIAQTPDGLQMIMEFYPGGTLADMIKKRGALKPLVAIDIARQVGLALAYAHSLQFVHRDVKPANVFMAPEGHVILGDFGIVSHADSRGEHTQTGVVIGTPLYMAPEQGVSSSDVDPRADIYALGLTLYHMLTGQPPRMVDMDLVPPAFRALIKSAIHADRSKRMVSAKQFVDHLLQIRDRILAEASSRGIAQTGGVPSSGTPGLAGVTLTDSVSTDSDSDPAPDPAFEAWTPPPEGNENAATVTDSRGASAEISTETQEPATKRGLPRWAPVAAGLALIVMAGMAFQHFRGAQNVSGTKSADASADHGTGNGAADQGALPEVASTPAPSATAPPAAPPSPSPSPTASPAATMIAVVAATASPSPTVTPTPTPSPTPTFSQTPTPKPTPPPDWFARFDQAVGARSNAAARPKLKLAFQQLRAKDDFRNPVFLPRALQALEQEIQARPQDSFAPILMGLVDYRLDEIDDAAVNLKRGFALMPAEDFPSDAKSPAAFAAKLIERYGLDPAALPRLRLALGGQ